MLSTLSPLAGHLLTSSLLATAPAEVPRPLAADAPQEVTTPPGGPSEDPANTPQVPENIQPVPEAETEPPAASTTKPTFVPGIRYWVRGFGRQVTSFDAADPQHQYGVVHQARLHARASYGPVSGFLQFQDSRTWGFEQSTTTNSANTDLHQGYVDIAGSKGSLSGSIRLGRQEIVIGSRHLFAERPWSPIGQAFNAVRLRGATKRVSLDVFTAILAPPKTLEAEVAGETLTLDTRGGYVGGGYLSVNAHPAAVVDAALFFDYEGPTADDINRDRRIVSPGLRLHGSPAPGLSYELEGYYQAGAQYRVPHRAWAVVGLLAYAFAAKTTPKLHTGYLLASGQSCTPAADGSCAIGSRSTEFFDFYRRRHGYQGMVDLALMRNIGDFEAGLELRPHKLITLNADYHLFHLQQPNGRWWRVPDNLVGSGFSSQNTARLLGQEFDFRFRAQPFKPFKIDVGYGLYLPLAAARAITGGSSPRHFWYLWFITEF